MRWMQIETLCSIVLSHTRMCRDAVHFDKGALRALRQHAKEGGFIDPRCIEHARLTDAANDHRKMAEEIEAVLATLEANAPAPFLQAAE